MPKHAVIILADGFEEVEAATPIDLLRRAGIDVTVAGLGAMEIRSAHELWFKADIELESYAGPFDALVLPGGMPGTRNLLESNHVTRIVEKAYSARIRELYGKRIRIKEGAFKIILCGRKKVSSPVPV